MKWTSTFIILMAWAFLIGACRSTPTEREIASGFCNCLQNMTEIYRQFQAQNETATDEEYAQLKQKLKTAGLESEHCMENIKIEYGEAVKNQEEKIKAAMREICPKVVETMTELDATYE